MVKLKISYETLDELEEVLQLLQPVISSYKVAKHQNGAYKKAYIDTTIHQTFKNHECPKRSLHGSGTSDIIRTSK